MKDNIFEVYMDKYILRTKYLNVFHAIIKLQAKDTPSIIAIDGMSGSGKSYLADLIEESFDCNVFHMDDFFLPLEMKTEERLAQPGANVHYERFKKEVLEPLIKQQTVIYQPYLCGKWEFGETVQVRPKKLSIIEGAYSMHPELRDAYDLKIFLSVDEITQLERIRNRSGEEKLKQFMEKWIPLENFYFNSLGIKDLCDISINTSDFC